MYLPFLLTALSLSSASAQEAENFLPALEEQVSTTHDGIEEPPVVVLPYLTVGALELVQLSGEPGHLGFYGVIQLDLLFPVGDSRWTVISSSGFEFAPENGNWGFYQFLVFDYYLGQVGSTVVTVEPQVGVVHNAAPLTEGFDHAFYPTAGLGFAFLTKDGTGPAIIPTLTASYGLEGEGVSLAAMTLFSVPIN